MKQNHSVSAVERRAREADVISRAKAANPMGAAGSDILLGFDRAGQPLTMRHDIIGGNVT